MDVLWFWAIILLLLIVVFAWPSWPYTRERGLYRTEAYRYYPSGIAAALAILLLLLIWLGIVAVARPW